MQPPGPVAGDGAADTEEEEEDADETEDDEEDGEGVTDANDEDDDEGEDEDEAVETRATEETEDGALGLHADAVTRAAPVTSVLRSVATLMILVANGEGRKELGGWRRREKQKVWYRDMSAATGFIYPHGEMNRAHVAPHSTQHTRTHSLSRLEQGQHGCASNKSHSQ